MRIERENDGRPADCFRRGDEALDQAGVAAMHAVEIADGHGGSAKLGREIVEAVEDFHGGLVRGVQRM
jgi:hypothetical protein